MGRCRIVSPESVRLPLSDGDFLTVKKELNAGEYVDYLTDRQADRVFAAPLAYLVGWSLVGVGEQPIPYAMGQSRDERRDVLRSLDQVTLLEIVKAIDAHASSTDRTVEEKKTIPEPALA